MLKIAFMQLLSHLQSQNTWANGVLQPHAGESIQFKVHVLSQNFMILENGALAIAGESLTPETIVSMSPSTLLRLIAKDDAAKSNITIEGNNALATDVAKVFANMRWDITSDMSRVIGDVPAETISRLTKRTVATVKASGINAIDMVTEYLQEEAQVIAKPRHIETFNQAVDDLRADVDRFEKRLNRLSKQLTTTNTQPN